MSQHYFKSQRRYAAIQRHEAQMGALRIENLKLKMENRYFQDQLDAWALRWHNDGHEEKIKKLEEVHAKQTRELEQSFQQRLLEEQERNQKIAQALDYEKRKSDSQNFSHGEDLEDEESEETDGEPMYDGSDEDEKVAWEERQIARQQLRRVARSLDDVKGLGLDDNEIMRIKLKVLAVCLGTVQSRDVRYGGVAENDFLQKDENDVVPRSVVCHRAEVGMQTQWSLQKLRMTGALKIYGPADVQSVVDSLVMPMARVRDEVVAVLAICGVDPRRHHSLELGLHMERHLENAEVRDQLNRYVTTMKERQAAFLTLEEVYDKLATECVASFPPVIANVENLHSIVLKMASLGNVMSWGAT